MTKWLVISRFMLGKYFSNLLTAETKTTEDFYTANGQ